MGRPEKSRDSVMAVVLQVLDITPACSARRYSRLDVVQI